MNQLDLQHTARHGRGKSALLTLLALAAITSLGIGQTTYTWTGAVSDDWNIAGNWDANGIPADTLPSGTHSNGLSLNPGEKIVFDVAGPNPLPSAATFPALGGSVSPHDTPGIEIAQGGPITLNVAGREGDIWSNVAGTRNVLTVGDGTGAAGEVVVTLTSTATEFDLARHNSNTTNNFQVNSDGILNLTNGIVDFGWDSMARHGKFTIDGGQVNFSGEIKQLTAFSARVIDFTAIGGSFTAEFGGDFADIAAVELSLGVDFLNNSGGVLQAIDNGGPAPGTFTVSAIVAPDPNYWTGTGGATWDETPTVNFTTNDEAAPLVEDTFAVAKALQGKVTFADEYFDTGVSQAVSQTSVSIAAGGVSIAGGEVAFTNTGGGVSYDISATDTTGITGDTKVSVSGGGMVTLNSPNTHSGTTSVTGGSTLVLADSLAVQNSTLSGNAAPVFDQSVLSDAFTLAGLASGAAIALENNAGSPAPIELLVGNTDADSSHSGGLTGTGSLTKIGTGTLTLGGNTSNYTGDTLIKSGTLRSGAGNGQFGWSQASAILLGDTSGSADATLQFDQASSTTFTNPSITVQSGNTGVASLHNSGNSTVQIPAIILGSPGSAGKDLRIETVGTNANWEFRFYGVIQDPAGLPSGTAGTVTIAGTGEVVYHGQNTYSGNTVVESGEFYLQPAGSLTFYPTTNGITNQLVGASPFSGTVTMNGPITVDLSGADATVGNSWKLIDDTDLAAVVAYNAGFGVTSTDGTFIETAVDSGIWSLADGLYEWIFDQDTGTLSYNQVQDYKLWTGIGGATWDAMTTSNFANNIPADAVDNTTFNVATATTMAAQFADEYWNNGSTVAVTQNNITIAPGGVETGLIDFINETLAYSVDSSDGNGIKGASALAVRGGGTVTLTGIHSYSGATTVGLGSTLNVGDGTTDGSITNSPITNEGTFAFNTLGAIGHDGAIANSGSLVLNGIGTGTITLNGGLSGAGTVEMQGAGTATVTLAATYTGATTITGGTLIFQDTYSSPSFDIATGAVLELNDSGVARNYASVTFTGAGTLRKTGSVEARWGGSIANFELDSGALIDVQGGILKGGSNANDVWTSNLSDLNVASGATFRGTEANVRVDELTGDGNIISGFGGAGYMQFTMGVDNGSATFDGVLGNDNAPGNFTKVGTGTQTLAGLNTYTGNTSIEEGAIILADGGQLTFVPTLDTVTNQVTGVAGGTESIALDGTLYLNLGAADATSGNSWILVDDTDLTVTYGATFGVDSSLGTFLETGAGTGVWFLDDGFDEWSFDEATGTLSYGPAQNQKFWTGINGATWDAATTSNFANNIPSAAVDNTTFDVATAFTMKAKFADFYYDTGVETAVTQTSVTIAAGGVETGTIEFLNDTLDYIVDSSDTNGIMGATAVEVRGLGEVTLRGTHSYTGATTIAASSLLNVGDGTIDGSIANSPITNDGLLVFNNTGAVSQDGALSGSGSLEKLGAGTLTVTSNSSLNGGTTITAGTLAFQGQIGAGIHDIASGAVLELNNDTAAILSYPAMTFSGAGTLRKTGVDEVNWPASIAIFDLASDALIDIQAGTLVGGNSANEDWTTNLSDLNVALAGTFRGVEANVRVDVLTGEGVINSGHPDASYVQFTMGVDNGSGTFDGTLANTVSPGNFTKVGSGTQTLTGANTYTGNTTIEEGTLTIADGGELTLVPAANGVNNVIAGVPATTGTINLDGDLYIALGSADTTPGNSWLLVDDTNLTVNYNPTTFEVYSSLGLFTGAAGVWTLDDTVNVWTFTEATGTLTVSASGTDYATWIATFGLTDTSFDNGDDDGDGLGNGIEGFFGTDPSVFSTGLTQVDRAGNKVTFTHPNPDSGDELIDVTGDYEWSLDLDTWYADDGVEGDGSTTVTTMATAVGNTTTVEATIVGTVPTEIFLRAVATQN